MGNWRKCYFCGSDIRINDENCKYLTIIETHVCLSCYNAVVSIISNKQIMEELMQKMNKKLLSSES